MGTNFNLLKNYFDFLIGSLEMKRMLNLGTENYLSQWTNDFQ